MSSMRSAALVGVALAALTACGGGSTIDRAGGDSKPVTLRLATPDQVGRPASDQIEEFASQVEELSEGRLRIEPLWDLAGERIDDWDQVYARRVMDGEAELGLIPSRAWDVLGVTTLRAINAPFVLSSEHAVEQVVTSEVATQLLAGLDAAGVTGLGLFPEEQRRMFLVGDPPPTLADLEGRYVRAPRSDTVYAFFEALGATPDDFGDDDNVMTAALVDGRLAAAESSFGLATSLGLPTVAAGDLALFPKLNSLVANTEAFADLGNEDQQILRNATRATLDWAITQQPDEVAQAQQYCRDGGQIVVDGTVTGTMSAAADAVIDQLDDDPSTADLIQQVRSIAAAAPGPARIEPCSPESNPGSRAGTVRAEGSFPDGVYRADITYDSLIAAGVNELDATNHAGQWTLVFDGDVLRVNDVNASTGVESEGVGVYCVEDGRIVLGLLGDPPTCGDFWNAAWEADGDQLRFVDVVSGHGSQQLIAALFGGTPFTKIG